MNLEITNRIDIKKLIVLITIRLTKTANNININLLSHC